MSDRDAPDDLPPELASLFAAERRRPAPSPEQKARVQAAIALTVAAGATTATAAAATSAVTSAASAGTSAIAGGGAAGAAAGGAGVGVGAKITGLVLATAIAGVAGYGGVTALRDPAAHAPLHAPPQSSPMMRIRPPSSEGAQRELLQPAAPPASSPAMGVLPAAKPLQTPPRPAAMAAKPPPHAPPASSPEAVPSPAEPIARATALREERALLEGARRDLAGGRPAAALAAVDAHGERFAAGALAEEREALRIQALVRLDRGADARAALARFRGAWPSSLFLPTLEASVP